MNKIWGWVGAILATAEQTVPIFIHNPTSQQIEGVVMTEGNQLFATLAQMYAAPPAAAPGAQKSSAAAPGAQKS